MRTALLILALLSVSAYAAQTVWKWVDERGQTHYSDRPVPGAQPVEISIGNRADTVTPSSAPSTTSQRGRAQAAVESYREFLISQPANDDTFVNTAGSVTVTLQLDPPLQAGHALQLTLDGAVLEGFATSALVYELKEVPRGSHTVVATVLDATSKPIQSTRPVTFHVRQNSIQQPAPRRR